MKKILFTLISMIAVFTTANAQSMEVYQNGQLKAIYYISKDDKVEFSEDFPFPEKTEPTTPDKSPDGAQAVDLGLPSGIKWANMNIGATTPEGYGDYFAWGDPEPYYTAGHSQDNPCSNWKTGKSAGYDWASYKWCNGSRDTLTKYCTSSSYGTVDNKTTIEPDDDAAHVNWGGNWRMPTREELDELRSNCTWTWTTQKGVKGYKVSSKTNSNFIFLPAAGFRCLNRFGVYGSGADGYYWTSSLSTSDTYCARYIYLEMFAVRNDWDRYYGMSVRAVCQ